MQEIHGDFDLLIDLVNNYPLIGIGGGHKVINYQNTLIKISKELYGLIMIDDIKEARNYLQSLFFRFNYRINLPQINYLVKVQPNVKLTSLPLGTLDINNIPCGVLLKYHQNYLDLLDYEIKDYATFLDIVKQVLLRVKELEANDIYQLDLCARNILINKGKIELIDLDGMYLRIGNHKKNSAFVYEQYILLIKFLLNRMNEVSPFERINKITSYNSAECFSLLDDLVKEKSYVKL